MPTDDPNPLTGDDRNASRILTILLDHYPALLSVEELVSEYAGLACDRQPAELMVTDGLAALMGSGLAHKLDASSSLLARRSAPASFSPDEAPGARREGPRLGGRTG